MVVRRTDVAIAAGAMAAAAAFGAVIGGTPPAIGARLAALTIAAAFGGAWLWLSPQRRTIAAGALLGGGGIVTNFVSVGMWTLVLFLVLLTARPPARREIGPTQMLWLTAAALLTAAVWLTTSDGARVNLTALLTIAAILMAGTWTLGEDPGEDKAPGLVLLQTAGLVGGALVMVSYGVGHPITPTTEEAITNSTVAATGTLRGAGAFVGPNLAGMVLSASAIGTLIGLIQSPSINRRLTMLSLSVAVVGVFLTGSRSSLLALGLASIVLFLPILARHRKLAAWMVGTALLAAPFAQAAGVFTGRSLNPFSADDQAAYFRKQIKSTLYDRISWTDISGFGYKGGNQIAPNYIIGNFPNVDDAWLHATLTLGILGTAGFVVLLLTQALSTSRAGLWFALAAIAWFIPTSLAENLFVATEPCIAAVLMLGAAGVKRRAPMVIAAPVAAAPRRRARLV